MQKYFLKVQRFLIKFNLWSNAIAVKFKNDRFRILLDAAYNCIIKYSSGLRVGPHCQLLQQTPTLCAVPTSDVHCVSQKYTIQPPMITLTVIIRFQQFLVQIVISEYAIKWPSNSGLNSHLTCLVYLPYLAKL